jgi:hypothetical protein
MNEQRSRQLIVAISGTLILWIVIIRRRAAVLDLPGIVEDRIVLPMGDWMRENRIASRTTEPNGDRKTRKVGRNRKISVDGKLYGPVEPALVGKQVEVEQRDGNVVVWFDNAEVGQFEQQ